MQKQHECYKQFQLMKIYILICFQGFLTIFLQFNLTVTTAFEAFPFF